MIIDFTNILKILASRDKTKWHYRFLFFRFLKIGGYGADNTDSRRVFILCGFLWARYSSSRALWLYSKQGPIVK